MGTGGFEEAIAVLPQSSHTYTAAFKSEWCVGTGELEPALSQAICG